MTYSPVAYRPVAYRPVAYRPVAYRSVAYRSMTYSDVQYNSGVIMHLVCRHGDGLLDTDVYTKSSHTVSSQMASELMRCKVSQWNEVAPNNFGNM